MVQSAYLIHAPQTLAADKKRPKDEKDIVHRLRPFAKLQSADDYEAFCADIVCKLHVSHPLSAAIS